MFIDQSRDMWIRGMANKGAAVKLASMVDCATWHDAVGMLAFLADHKLVSLHFSVVWIVSVQVEKYTEKKQQVDNHVPTHDSAYLQIVS